VRRIVLRPDSAPDAAPALTVDYEAALDAQQRAAATAGRGATLIVAGAGTGKTRTLVYRLAYLVETGTPPEQMALLTFTRRAAHEMLARAARLLDGRCARVHGGTFHSVCADLLRRHAPRLGYPSGFSILDAADAADVLDLIRTERGLDRSGLRFPRKAALRDLFSAAENRGLPLDEVVAETAPHAARHLDALADLRAAYADYKRRYGLMDYDDLLARTRDLLADDDARREIAGAYRHVLVDEYQDVNHLQADLVAGLASVHGNVTVVGDDAQSIYRFRGADVGHILGFPSRYPGARVCLLEQNYRSTQPILDVANHVAGALAAGYDKRLFTRRPGGERPALVAAPDDHTEARFVAQMVLDKREEGTPLHRMAVLFRSGWCSFALEAELARRQVPFVKFGGLRLAEAAHVKDVLAHLRVADNPADAVAWNRTLRLVEGVGPATARRLLDWIGRAAGGALDADGSAAALAGIVPSDAVARRVADLAALVAGLRAPDAPLDAQMDRLLAYYRPLLDRHYPDDTDARAHDLDALAALAARHATRGALLEALALEPLDLAVDGVEGELADEAPLVLSTIHSAKGLEFDTVFLIHALDGVLPSAYALRTEAETDEERRLLDVALTRAETDLFVSYPIVQARRGSGAFLTDPSRFLRAIPDDLLEPCALVEETPAGALPPHADRALDDGR
jgi:DNA helicase-2/ATP-dependent DNA helicase PcrA